MNKFVFDSLLQAGMLQTFTPKSDEVLPLKPDMRVPDLMHSYSPAVDTMGHIQNALHTVHVQNPKATQQT